MILYNKFFLYIILLFFHSVYSVKSKPIIYELTFCEGQIAIITCDENTVISMQLANYGRFTLAICNPTANDLLDTNCYSNKTLSILKNKCEGKNECDISVDNYVFGNHCPETSKYLEVKYICISPPSKISPTNATTLCNCTIEEDHNEKEQCSKFQKMDSKFLIMCITVACFGSAILGALFLYIFLQYYYKLIKKSEMIQQRETNHEKQQLKNTKYFEVKIKENDVNAYDEIM